MKAIIIIGDGMADQPLRQLNYRTPLEAAGALNMDQLASLGVSGLLHSAGHLMPESDTANLALLGYSPLRDYVGRGGFEAAGAGIPLTELDLAFRCDFATVDEDFRIVDERAGRIREEASMLAEALRELRLKTLPEVEVIYRQTLGFKGVLILRGEGLSANVDAPQPRLGRQAILLRPRDASAEAKRTCMALKEVMVKTHQILKDHPVNRRRKAAGKPPANVIIPWGPGKAVHLQPFRERFGLRATCVAAAPLIKGMARLADIIAPDIPGATGEIDTDTEAKAEAALNALKSSDIVFVHVEGPDEASHDGDAYGKISIIRKIDSMVGHILKHVNLASTCLALLADHATSTRLRRHVDDPSPISLAGAGLRWDGVAHYNERAAAKGSLRLIRHGDVMPILLNLMGHER